MLSLSFSLCGNRRDDASGDSPPPIGGGLRMVGASSSWENDDTIDSVEI